jgi:integrase
MASVGRITTKDGNVHYRARWRDPSGAQKAQTFTRQKDAQRFLDSVEESKHRGVYIDPQAGRQTVSEFGEQWRRGLVHHRERSADNMERVLRLHVYPAFGDRGLNSVRRSEVQSWVASLSEKMKPGTVGKVYAALAALFRAAVSDGLIGRSPCYDIKRPAADSAHIEPLALAQVNALIDAVPDRYRALIVLLTGTGLRPSEALGLTQDRVDFLRRQVKVDRQLLSKNKAEVVFGPPKTQHSIRVVPAPRMVIDALAGHVASYPSGRDGLLFTDERGRPIILGSLYGDRRNTHVTWFTKATRAADLPADLSLHDLRHFYASLLIRQGADVKLVQSRLGHASAQTTLDVYGHLWPDHDDRTRSMVDEVFAGVEAAYTTRSS